MNLRTLLFSALIYFVFVVSPAAQSSSFKIELARPFDLEFHYKEAIRATSLYPWISMEIGIPDGLGTNYFCAYTDKDKYLFVLSTHYFEHQLRYGYFIDIWNVQELKYIGRSVMAAADDIYEKEFYKKYFLEENHVFFDEKSMSFYTIFYKDKRLTGEQYYVKTKLNETTPLNKVVFLKQKANKIASELKGLKKVNIYHDHYHSPASHSIANDNYGALSWVDSAASVNAKFVAGAMSYVMPDNTLRLILCGPNEKADELDKINNVSVQNIDRLLEYIKTTPDAYFKEVALRYLLGRMDLPAGLLRSFTAYHYERIYQELPSLRERVHKELARCAINNQEKTACEKLLELYPGSPYTVDVKKVLNNLAIAELLPRLKFSEWTMLEGDQFKGTSKNTVSNDKIPLFDRISYNLGQLQYLMTGTVSNPTDRTLHFFLEADLGVKRIESASILGFSTSRGSAENIFKYRIAVLDLAPKETRNVAFLFDLGLYMKETKGQTSVFEMRKNFAVSSKKVTPLPIAGSARGVEAALFKHIKPYELARQNYPQTFKSTPIKGIDDSKLSYLDLKKKTYEAAKKIAPQPVVRDDNKDPGIMDKLHGVWKGKYTVADVLDFDIEMAMIPMDASNVDVYIKYTLLHSKCPTVNVLYGRSFYDEGFATLDNGELNFNLIGSVVDRFRIWVASQYCLELEKSNGKQIAEINASKHPFRLAVGKAGSGELQGNSLLFKEVELNVALQKIQNAAGAAAYYQAFKKETEQEINDLYKVDLRVSKVIRTDKFTVVGIMALVRDEKEAVDALFELDDPKNTVNLTSMEAKPRLFKLVHYAGISIKNSDKVNPYHFVSIGQCRNCGARYRYFELYFEPIPLKDGPYKVTLTANTSLTFNTDAIPQENLALPEPLSGTEIAGFNLDANLNYRAQTNVANCKCYHPTTQQLLEVWHSHNVKCINGLVSGKDGLVNFSGSLAYAKEWIGGKSQGPSASINRMHPAEAPKQLAATMKNFQTVTAHYPFENNVIRTIDDKPLGWQMEAIMNGIGHIAGAISGMSPRDNRPGAATADGYQIAGGDCRVSNGANDRLVLYVDDGGNAVSGAKVDDKTYSVTYETKTRKKTSTDPFRDSLLDVLGAVRDDELPVKVTVYYKLSGQDKSKSTVVHITNPKKWYRITLE
ncbi:MAG: hypothetical protein KF852_04420 [Saprospiraceae bacterium]|nr:hypothetical protein [Saprospiraceae bacterium]